MSKDTKKEINKEVATIKKEIKGLPATIIIAIVLILLVTFIISFIYPIFKKANETGEVVGNTLGKAAGSIVGIYEGLTIDAPKGREDGKQAGLSAEDTTVEMTNEISSLGSGVLEVLKADISLKVVSLNGTITKEGLAKITEDIKNFLKGEGKTASQITKPAYARMYILPGEAVFTSDLSTANIEYSSDKSEIIITIPKPKVNIRINETGNKVQYEYIGSNDGTEGIDAITAELNSKKQLVEKSPETLENYPFLIEQAKDSARTQITMLTQALVGKNVKVTVNFMEGNDD